MARYKHSERDASHAWRVPCPDHFSDLSSDALLIVAQYHEAIAEACRKRAAWIADRGPRVKLPDPVPRVPDRFERNRRIILLASRGWTNRRIAEDTGLSEAQISRIVRASISAGQTAPATADKPAPTTAPKG